MIHFLSKIEKCNKTIMFNNLLFIIYTYNACTNIIRVKYLVFIESLYAVIYTKQFRVRVDFYNVKEIFMTHLFGYKLNLFKFGFQESINKFCNTLNDAFHNKLSFLNFQDIQHMNYYHINSTIYFIINIFFYVFFFKYTIIF